MLFYLQKINILSRNDQKKHPTGATKTQFEISEELVTFVT